MLDVARAPSRNGGASEKEFPWCRDSAHASAHSYIICASAQLVQAGMLGTDMDMQLANKDVCVGHEPDSCEFSSVGE